MTADMTCFAPSTPIPAPGPPISGEAAKLVRLAAAIVPKLVAVAKLFRLAAVVVPKLVGVAKLV